ncbi:hypothetical protein BDN72DRAFT_57780 [Pluteus cervinus]|uniref:Uncharacterized protein n=1 Tax=Pluteus cervinus TaxID=181527 RepID=A0ACD3B928_9AGAR|nr:hypothetical protein BDN72DRAFT_57780 [Pluteus cervinus]
MVIYLFSYSTMLAWSPYTRAEFVLRHALLHLFCHDWARGSSSTRFVDSLSSLSSASLTTGHFTKVLTIELMETLYSTIELELLYHS